MPLGTTREAVLVLMASLLVGPAAWEPVAEALADMGREAVVVPHDLDRMPDTVSEATELYARSIPNDRDVVLVPHSNAGNFVPAMIASRSVAGVVFVDSVIPVASGMQPIVPVPFLAEIEKLADRDGALPRWTEWFPGEDIAALLPDPAVRADIASRQPIPSLPLLRSSLTIQAGWDSISIGYLAFGDSYADERVRAARQGWRAVKLDGGHLHMAVDPERVAREIRSLCDG